MRPQWSSSADKDKKNLLSRKRRESFYVKDFLGINNNPELRTSWSVSYKNDKAEFP